jgi:hypothetical protein
MLEGVDDVDDHDDDSSHTTYDDELDHHELDNDFAERHVEHDHDDDLAVNVGAIDIVVKFVDHHLAFVAEQHNVFDVVEHHVDARRDEG